ncbi:MAG: hypothetical protein MJ069_10605, partial [Salinivirgaceae bacterium]|nr:hypothetical protein [Salinivirgaceae bacterium]
LSNLRLAHSPLIVWFFLANFSNLVGQWLYIVGSVCFLHKWFALRTQQLVNNKISRGIKTKNVGVITLLIPRLEALALPTE